MKKSQELHVLDEMISSEKAFGDGLKKLDSVIANQSGYLGSASNKLLSIQAHVKLLISFSDTMHQNLEKSKLLIGSESEERQSLMNERLTLIADFIKIRKDYDDAYFKLLPDDLNIELDGGQTINQLLILPVQRASRYKDLIEVFLKKSGDRIKADVKTSCLAILETLEQYLNKFKTDSYKKAKTKLEKVILDLGTKNDPLCSELKTKLQELLKGIDSRFNNSTVPLPTLIDVLEWTSRLFSSNLSIEEYQGLLDAYQKEANRIQGQPYVWATTIGGLMLGVAVAAAALFVLHPPILLALGSAAAVKTGLAIVGGVAAAKSIGFFALGARAGISSLMDNVLDEKKKCDEEKGKSIE